MSIDLHKLRALQFRIPGFCAKVLHEITKQQKLHSTLTLGRSKQMVKGRLEKIFMLLFVTQKQEPVEIEVLVTCINYLLWMVTNTVPKGEARNSKREGPQTENLTINRVL